VSLMHRNCCLARFERNLRGRDSRLGFQAARAQESARAACFEPEPQACHRPMTAPIHRVLC
jgi:hypothetical protein